MATILLFISIVGLFLVVISGHIYIDMIKHRETDFLARGKDGRPAYFFTCLILGGWVMTTPLYYLVYSLHK